jgi:hypothetical protein
VEEIAAIFSDRFGWGDGASGTPVGFGVWPIYKQNAYFFLVKKMVFD